LFLQQLLGKSGVEFEGLKFKFIGVPAQDNYIIGVSMRMRYYTFSSRNFALDQPDDAFRELIRTIFTRIALSSRASPEELPLDLTEELHLKGPDAGTLKYRRMLSDLP
jgi:hypothetical protein